MTFAHTRRYVISSYQKLQYAKNLKNKNNRGKPMKAFLIFEDDPAVPGGVEIKVLRVATNGEASLDASTPANNLCVAVEKMLGQLLTELRSLAATEAAPAEDSCWH
jgi:hypothetical protein